MYKQRYPKGTWMKLTSGATLRALMDQWGLSNADVAMAAGCGRTFISALVHERRTSCTPEVAKRIAHCVRVPTEVLFVAKPSAASSGPRKTKAKAAA